MKKNYSTKIKFIEVENKNRTIISMVFPIKMDRKNIMLKNLAYRMISNHNKYCKTLNDFETKMDDLYIMNYNISQYNYSNFIFFNIKFCIPKLGIIKEFDLDAAIKFLYDCLYNPLASNNSFDEVEFNKEKEYMLNRQKEYPTSFYEYFDDCFLDLYDEERVTSLHHDEVVKFLEEANAKDCYEFYKNNVLNNKYLTYIYGNLDYKDEILKSFNKYFNVDENSFEEDFEYFNYLPLKEYKEKREVTKYNQSAMALLYQVENMSENDYFKVMMFDSFLSDRENNLLFKKLRTNYNIIYNCNASYNILYGLIALKAFFNIKDEAIVIKAIDEIFEDLKDKDKFEDYKQRMLRAIEYDIYASLDNDFLKVEVIIGKELSYYHTYEEKKENFEKITYEEFMAFLDRIKLTRKLVAVAGGSDE